MNFFLSTTYALIVLIFSTVTTVGLTYYGHLVGMDPAVATSCFIGLIAIIATAAFLTFVAFAQKLTINK